MPATMATSERSCGEAGAFTAVRDMHHAHRVFHRHALRHAVLQVDLRAPQGGQQQGFLADDQVAAIELGGHLHRQRALAQRGKGQRRVRRGGREIAAQRNEHFDVAALHGFDAWPPRRGHARAAARSRTPGPGGRGRPLSAFPRCPPCGRPARWSGRARDTARRRGLPIWPRSIIRFDSMRMAATLCLCCVRPMPQVAMTRWPLTKMSVNCLDLRARHARFRHAAVPSFPRAGRRGRRRSRCSVRAMKAWSMTAGLPGRLRRIVMLDDALGDGLDQGEVAAQGGLDEQAGQARAAQGRHFQRALRVHEALQAPFAQGIDGNDAAAAARAVAQFAQHARVVGGGILAEDEDGVGQFEVVQGHRALADAHGGRQAAAGRLVAHVGAVGEVIGAVQARHQLVQKGGLVAGAPRRVERGLVRIGQGAQVAAHEGVGVVPGNRHVAVAGGVVHHRLRQAAMLFQRVVRLLQQLRDGMAGKQLAGRRGGWSLRRRRPWRRFRKRQTWTRGCGRARRSRGNRNRPAGFAPAAPSDCRALTRSWRRLMATCFRASQPAAAWCRALMCGASWSFMGSFGWASVVIMHDPRMTLTCVTEMTFGCHFPDILGKYAGVVLITGMKPCKT